MTWILEDHRRAELEGRKDHRIGERESGCVLCAAWRRDQRSAANRGLYDEALALLTALQQYTDGKINNGLVYHDVLKPWLDDFLVRSALPVPMQQGTKAEVEQAIADALTIEDRLPHPTFHGTGTRSGA